MSWIRPVFSIVFPAFEIRRVWPDDHRIKSDAFSFPDAAESRSRLETRGIRVAAVNNFVHEFPGSVAVQVGCWKP